MYFIIAIEYITIIFYKSFLPIIVMRFCDKMAPLRYTAYMVTWHSNTSKAIMKVFESSGKIFSYKFIRIQNKNPFTSAFG